MTKQTLELKLTSLSHDGRAIGRIVTNEDQKQVVFVQDGLPGQVVRADIVKAKKNFIEAICTEILEQSPDYIAPKCEHALECGGCPLQAMPYEQQLFWKENMLKDALQRIGKIKEIPFTKLYASPLLWAYRNKMEFAVGKSKDTANTANAKGELILGLRATNSHHVISTPKCLLMPTECGSVLQKLLKLMKGTGFEPWQNGQGLWRHVVIRKPYASSASNNCHVQIITAQTSPENRLSIARIGQELLNSDLGVTGFVHDERTSSTLYAQGEQNITKLGQNIIQENLSNTPYLMDYSSFFQINTPAAEFLCTEVQEMANLSGEEIIWDIYCGVGAPSLSFAKNAKELYAVESNAQAINMAKKNAENLGFEHCNYFTGTAENTIAQAKAHIKKHVKKHINNQVKAPTWPKPDVIILDPPRAGLHAKVTQAILNAKPKRIIYISCNPATLARDIALLSVDYLLEKVSAVDLFPHTAHVESCVLLTKK